MFVKIWKGKDESRNHQMNGMTTGSLRSYQQHDWYGIIHNF